MPPHSRTSSTKSHLPECVAFAKSSFCSRVRKGRDGSFAFETTSSLFLGLPWIHFRTASFKCRARVTREMPTARSLAGRFHLVGPALGRSGNFRPRHSQLGVKSLTLS